MISILVSNAFLCTGLYLCTTSKCLVLRLVIDGTKGDHTGQSESRKWNVLIVGHLVNNLRTKPWEIKFSVGIVFMPYR